MFFNVWIAGVYFIYSVGFNVLAWPIKHCQYCYYKVRATTEDNPNEPLLPLDEWKGLYLEKHVACGKKWGKNLFILWLGPIVLIIISFFLNYSMNALFVLIGFIGVLAAQGIYTRWKVCPTCAFMEECHAAF